MRRCESPSPDVGPVQGHRPSLNPHPELVEGRGFTHRLVTGLPHSTRSVQATSSFDKLRMRFGDRAASLGALAGLQLGLRCPR